MKPNPRRVVVLLALTVGRLTAAPTPMAMPEGTRAKASFATEADGGPELLIDGNPATQMRGQAGSCRDALEPVWVDFVFPAPVADLAGVETGKSDPFHNYYPKRAQFWVDTDGNGTFDTLGASARLGPAAQAAGQHLFGGRLPRAHALRFLVLEQNRTALNRGFILDEVRLVVDPEAAPLVATPERCVEETLKEAAAARAAASAAAAKAAAEERRRNAATTYTELLPKGTTARVTVATEVGQGAEALLDNDPTTFLNPRQGTARENQPVSIFLTFPNPVEHLDGIDLGRSDPHGNYVWQEMEFHADTDGDGRYDTPAGRASGGRAGRKRFDRAIPTVHGLELRVTRQTLRAVFRAFMLSGIEGLIFRDDPGDGQMRFVLEDFEDLASWRTWGDNTAQPEGERSYGGYIYLCGVLDPAAPSGNALGKFRYCFHEPKQRGQDSNWLRAKRGVVSAREAFMDRLEFMANPQGYPCTIHFALVDSQGKAVHTPRVSVTGTAWRAYAIDLSPAAWPQGTQLTPPLRIENIWLRSAKGGTGDVLLDDIAAVGVVGRNQRVTIRPVWEGLVYDPAKPLVINYRLRNALNRELRAPLEAALYSVYDPGRTAPVAMRAIPVTLPKWGEVVQAVDFGAQPYGHYEVELRLTAPGVAAQHTDLVAVATLNGGRVNRAPMWVGAQHPADWISAPENAFVFREVVGPLGMDVYRTGAPDRRVIDLGMFCAAGFGGLPPHLHKQGARRPDIDEPNDYAAYTAWVKERAAKQYAPFVDRILSVEFYNEPDLPDFCFIPGIDTYLKMWRAWAEGMRAGAPGIKLGTGGNTVLHSREKPDFNRRMYTELAREADVAIWHAHGGLENFAVRHRMVENWLEKGGRPQPEQRLGNSEAGVPSHNSPVERLHQADALVKKIGWAKSQPNSLFYTWFTTTDTYDPQGEYMFGVNWGLITYNQRLKPSGLAMNALIRQLANTQGLGETQLDPRLRTCAFVHADGTQVWLAWPNEAGAAFLLTLVGDSPIEMIDMFGRRKLVAPENGRLTLRVNGWPFYLRAPMGTRLRVAETPPWLTLPAVVGVPPGGRAAFAVGIRNAWGPATALAAAVEDLDGAVVATAKVIIPANGQTEARFAFDLPADLHAGSRGYIFRTRDPEGGAAIVVPLTVAVGELIPRVENPLMVDGRFATPARTAKLVLDRVAHVHNLVDDPATPRWAGKEDLSAAATLAHDGQGILVVLAVRDQTHLPGEPGVRLWAQDSVQVAFALDGQQTEFGLTAGGGGAGFCWISPDANLAGQPLAWPFEVTRAGDVTTYRSYVPFAALGGAYRPGMLLRMTFLVNEDDGRGRVRLLKWFDGIHPDKDVRRFGYLVLE